MEQTTTALQVQQPVGVFASIANFEDYQRMAKVFVNSNLVPATFKGDMGACLIALNMANRMGADPLQVMQSLYIVHGKPSFSSAFLIACFNQCGRYTAIRYEMVGERDTDSWGCKAYTTEKSTGEVIEGVAVTIGMAKAEGWYNKAGSKWKTMPELMMRYRAATFLIRSVAPEIALGFQTTEEVRDVIDITDRATVVGAAPSLEDIALQAMTPTAQAQAEQPAEVENNTEDNRTPLARFYGEMKAKHPDKVLLFRMGDFYESYGADAKTVSDVLGITLTRTNREDFSVMAGFPNNALDTYLPKLVRAGKQVAICDQLDTTETNEPSTNQPTTLFNDESAN